MTSGAWSPAGHRWSGPTRKEVAAGVAVLELHHRVADLLAVCIGEAVHEGRLALVAQVRSVVTGLLSTEELAIACRADELDPVR